jgi:hypothetical protein
MMIVKDSTLFEHGLCEATICCNTVCRDGIILGELDRIGSDRVLWEILDLAAFYHQHRPQISA